MSGSLDEYRRRWEHAVENAQEGDIPFDADVAPQSCVIFESAHSTPMGEGATALPDFGDAICFYRYYRIPDELEPHHPSSQPQHDAELAAMLPGLSMLQQSWERRRPKLTDEQLHERKARADQALDVLLEEFTHEGYRPEMQERLRTVVNNALLDFELHEVFVLPGDLDALLAFTGNPLADDDADEYESTTDEHEADTQAPRFDLANPEHRAALKERVQMIGR